MKGSTYLAGMMVLALSGVGLTAQETARLESFQGQVKAVSGSSVTVERGTITGIFTVDPNTHITARGATTKTKENQAAGKPSLTVPDVVHAGDQVVVKFHEKDGTMIASDIQVRVSLAER
jgi:hypothetical protein